MTTTRRGLLTGVLALAGSAGAAASVLLTEEPGHSPDVWCIDCNAQEYEPGYVWDWQRYQWAVYLDGINLLPVIPVLAADEKAGFVDVYVGSGRVTRQYGKVRIVRGEPWGNSK